MISLKEQIEDLHKQYQDFQSRHVKDITTEFELRSKLRDLSQCCKVSWTT